MTPIRPPFDKSSALAKVKAAEDAWNSRDPNRVALAYSEDSEWRNRAEILRGGKTPLLADAYPPEDSGPTRLFEAATTLGRSM